MSTEEKVDALLLNAIVNGHSSIETYFHGLSENDRRALATQALSWAITVENVTKAEQLLSYGAAVNIREPSGSTLLHVAASRRNALRLVTLLLGAGVTIDLRDSQGCFALFGQLSGLISKQQRFWYSEAQCCAKISITGRNLARCL